MAVGGNELREAAEGVLNVVQVLEEVQMVGLDVENDRDGGEEAQERVAVFAALGDDGVAVADAVAGVEQRQCAADHHGGVGVRSHEDVRRHAGGGRFAVRAGDAQGVAVAVHDRAPRLRTLKDRDAACDRAGDLGIVVVDGSGADNKIGIAEIVRRVTDGDGNAQRAQVLHGGGVVHVAALHGESHGMQDLGERAHRHAADAGEVRPLAGYEIGIDIHSVFLPKSTHSDSLRHLPKSARK
jgi:hypothetical protein